MTQTAPEAPSEDLPPPPRVIVLGFIGGIATGLGRTAGAGSPGWLQSLL
ncbi:hypothetical protein [Streptomyces sp. WZ.A104]|nr:hypothetical protein [Streptomyces sp. WZ.A104]